MRKEAVFTLKLESELRDEFGAAAAEMDRPASQIVREFMRDFVRTRQEER
jgi:predicted transcriptional regulator